MSYRDEEEYGGHPLIATLVAVAILLLTLGVPLTLPPGSGGAYRAGMLTGYFAFGPLILWGLAWAITIRKASPGWKIGSLIVIVLVNALVVIMRLGAPSAALASDMRGIATQFQGVLDADGNVSEIKAAPGAGPLTRVNTVVLNAMIGDIAAYGREAEAAGMGELDTTKLGKASPVLGRCDAIAALSARAAWYKGRYEDHLAQGHRVGEAAVKAGEMPREALDGFEEGARAGRGKLDRRWDLFAGMAEESAALCRLLKASAWTNRGGKVLFVRQQDLEAFQSHAARLAGYQDEEARMRDAAKASARDYISKAPPAP
ncbi:MAG: hypothetical protein V4574_12390 [Pseudomonadota bacterium]